MKSERLKITMSPGVPREIRKFIMREVSRRMWAIPGWYAHIIIVWRADSLIEKDDDSKDGEETPAEAMPQVEYHSAYIRFTGAFLTDSDEERIHTIRHELAHLVMTRSLNAYVDLVNAAVPEKEDSAFSKYAAEQIRRANEEVTEALALTWKRLEEESGFIKKS